MAEDLCKLLRLFCRTEHSFSFVTTILIEQIGPSLLSEGREGIYLE